jgi:GDPmannose 4,6-dehydratase
MQGNRKTALVTGVTGQDGYYLTGLLLDKGYAVYGLHRRCSHDNTRHLPLDNPRLTLVEGDVGDAHSVARLVADLRPDEIYNLAAQSHVATSFEQPAYTFLVNQEGPLNLFEAVRRHSPKSRVYQASTSEMFGSNYSRRFVYGDSGDAPVEEWFQDEQTPFAPNSHYAVAKLAAHHLAHVNRASYGLHLSAGILFNHESPMRPERFVTRKITAAVARMFHARKAGREIPRLRLGNLDAKRDWGFAGDYVRAMWLMLQRDEPDDYVIATGQTFSVRHFLDCAFWAAGFSPSEMMQYVDTDPAFLRPCEVPYLRGCAAKAKRALGWEPEVNFADLVSSMVHHDIAATVT